MKIQPYASETAKCGIMKNFRMAGNNREQARSNFIKNQPSRRIQDGMDRWRATGTGIPTDRKVFYVCFSSDHGYGITNRLK